MNNQVALNKLIQLLIEQEMNNQENNTEILGYSNFFDKDITNHDIIKIISVGNNSRKQIVQQIDETLLILNELKNINKELQSYINANNAGQTVIKPDKKGYYMPASDNEQEPIKYFYGDDKQIRIKIYRIFIKLCIQWVKFIKEYALLYNPFVQFVTQVEFLPSEISKVKSYINEFKTDLQENYYQKLFLHLNSLDIVNPNFEENPYINNILKYRYGAYSIEEEIYEIEKNFKYKKEDYSKQISTNDIDMTTGEFYIDDDIDYFIGEIMKSSIPISKYNLENIYNFLLSGFGDKMKNKTAWGPEQYLISLTQMIR